MLALLLTGQFMALLDVTIVNVAVPRIGTGLHASGAELQLVVAGYTVAYAMALITGARLGDLLGRRRMYLTGVVGFTLASLTCGLAPDIGVLIAARAVQGVSAAVMVPQIMSVIQTRYQGAARARALSAYGAVLSLGAVAGLVLGGVLVNADLAGSSWRPVFLVNVPIGIVLSVLVVRVMPADVPGATRRLDLTGLSVSVAAIVLVVLPLVLGHQLRWPAWTFACLVLGGVLSAAFVVLEQGVARRGGDPLLNPGVLRARGLRSGLVTLACMQVAYGGFLFTLTLHLQQGLHDSALRAGLTYVPMAAAFGFIGFFWRQLPGSVHAFMAPVGLAVCAVSYAGLSIALHGGSQGSVLFWIALVGVGLGTGASLSPLVTQALVNVPLTNAADASGLFTTTMQLSQVTGVAAFGSVYLSLSARAGSGTRPSAHAVSTTALWLALLAAVGMSAATSLARVVHRADSRPPTEPIPPTAAPPADMPTQA